MSGAIVAEARENPSVPGARVLRENDSWPAYVNLAGCMFRFYPLGEVNDLALFAYVEKRAVTDNDRPWVSHCHPGVEQYIYVIRGEGTMTLGLGDVGFEVERYSFSAGDVLIVPRDVAHRFDGDWDAVLFQSRTNVFGDVAGTSRYPNPVLIRERAPRPTLEEREALEDSGTFMYVAPTGNRALHVPAPYLKARAVKDLQNLRPDLSPVSRSKRTVDELYTEVTPVQRQTNDDEAVREALKNPTVGGPRVLRRSDANSLYNPNAGVSESLYPVGLLNDMAIVDVVQHSAGADIDHEFDSHAHPGIEEYMYVVRGHGTITFGVGDETFADERYEFGAGDLVITPRDIPHKNTGDWEVLVFHTRTSVFGQISGTSRYPHPVLIFQKPPRRTKEEEDRLFEPGTFFYVDPTETYNKYLSTPFIRTERSWAGRDTAEPTDAEGGRKAQEAGEGEGAEGAEP